MHRVEQRHGAACELAALVRLTEPCEDREVGEDPEDQEWGQSEAMLGRQRILIILPTLVVFILFQRQIIAALLQGSVKG